MPREQRDARAFGAGGLVVLVRAFAAVVGVAARVIGQVPNGLLVRDHLTSDDQEPAFGGRQHRAGGRRLVGRRYDGWMHIEPMTSADHAEVSALLRACFNWLADREGFNEVQRAFLVGQRSSVETLREESRTRPHIVARGDDGTILGMAAIREHEVARLYVHPRCHGQGVGKALFEAAEVMIRAAGHAEVTVAALVESAAAFYRARGMREVGRQPYEPEIFAGREVVLLAKPIAAP
jgi:ribosomal protein S18 acetylase RimI-like enzyme